MLKYKEKMLNSTSLGNEKRRDNGMKNEGRRGCLFKGHNAMNLKTAIR